MHPGIRTSVTRGFPGVANGYSGSLSSLSQLLASA